MYDFYLTMKKQFGIKEKLGKDLITKETRKES